MFDTNTCIWNSSQLSEKTRTSYADASPSIKSSFGTMLWIFKCIILKCLERYSNELDEQLETESILPSTESGPGFGCTSPHNKIRQVTQSESVDTSSGIVK